MDRDEALEQIMSDDILKDEPMDDLGYAKSPLTIEDIMEELNIYWLDPEEDAVRVVLATAIAFRLNTDPLWLFLIAPPSSLKTEIINGLRTTRDMYSLSSLTSQTLASGLKEKGKKGKTENHSLLTKIGSKVLLFKDFGTILSGRWDEMNAILGQLREIYDGEFTKEYGTGIKIDWKGKMGFVAGATQILDKHSTVNAILGERFVQYRMKGVDEIKASLQSMKNTGKETQIRERVQELFKEFLDSIDVPDPAEIAVPGEYLEGLANLASFAVKARSGTIRDSYKKELEYIPDPEAPTRLAKQLVILGKCLTLINRRKKMGIEEYAICVKVAFDSIPKQRLTTINALFDEDALEGISTTGLSEKINYSTPSTKIFLEDLNAFGLVDVEKGGSGTAHKWQVANKTKDYFLKSLIEIENPPNKLKNIYSWLRTVNQNSVIPSNNLLEVVNRKKNNKYNIHPSFSLGSKKSPKDEPKLAVNIIDKT